METSSKKFQLMEIETITIKDSVSGGSSIYGRFTERPTTRLCNLQGISVMNSLVLAMKIADNEMYNGKTGIFESFQFEAIFRKTGRLILKCPGDASGIYPSSDGQGRGDYEFGSCNVDIPVQQITLLVGLAVLHDEARKAGV